MVLHLVAAAHLDDGGNVQPVGGAPARHKHLQADAGGHLGGAAYNVRRRGGCIDQAVFGGLFGGGEHLHDGTGAGFGNAAHGLFHNVGETTFFVARGGVGVPIHAAGSQIVVVPAHFGGQPVSHFGADAAGGQQQHAVAHLGDFAEQHGGAALHQHVRRVARRRVGRNAREGVRAAALHADEQLRQRQLLPAAFVQLLQLFVGHIQNGLHHGVVALPVLQGQAVFGGDVLGRQHPVVGQLFAAQTHHHDLSAEIGVADDVGDGPDGRFGLRRIDGHAAAVGVGHRHHAVHVGVVGQQLFFDALHRHLHHARRALHGGHDAQKIPRARRAAGVAVAHPGGAGRGGQLLRRFKVGAPGHIVQRGAFGQVQHVLVDPASRRDGVFGVAQHHAVAHDRAAGGDVPQGDLVGLGNGVAGSDAAFDHRAGGQVMHRHRHVVLLFDLNGQTFSHDCSLLLSVCQKM